MTKRIKYTNLLFILSAISALVHNLIFVLIGKEEWFFFGLAILSFIAFFIFLFYSLMEFIITKEPKDLWKVGFLGLFGLIGLIPGFSPAFFGFFGLFGLFGTREYI